MNSNELFAHLKKKKKKKEMSVYLSIGNGWQKERKGV